MPVVEIFLNAWYSQSVIEEVSIAFENKIKPFIAYPQFQELSDAIFSINWDEASGSFRKKLAFTMSRCQSPTKITIGKFTNANLASAISVSVVVTNKC